MIRSELVSLVAGDGNLPKATADHVVDSFFEAIIERLAAGGRVELRGFGAFEVREYEAVIGRNPKTGVEVDRPGTRRPRFRLSAIQLKRMNPKLSKTAKTS